MARSRSRSRVVPLVVSASALVCIALLAASMAASAQDQPTGGTTRISVSFGPEQIWKPDQGALSGLFACQPGATFTCVSQVMQNSGASADAIAFYGLTGWFLSDLNDTGTVQLGTIFTPFRANENTQSALLGGYPPVIYPERELPPDAEVSAAFTAVKSLHPNAMLWQSSPTFEGMDASPQGGQRFTFSYRILDGCHACAVLGKVRVAFDFAPDGSYASASVVT